MPNRDRGRGLSAAHDVLRDDPLVARNVFVGNSAWEAGGGIRFCFFGGALPAPTVIDNLIIDNRAVARGGGIDVLAADFTCVNTTIAGNECTSGPGGGIYVGDDSAVTLRNSIVVGNTGSGIHLQAADLVTDYCDVFGNSLGDYVYCNPSATDLSCDPEFCAPESGDYQLHETSCCQGAGADGGDIGARGVGCFATPGVLFYDNFSDHDDVGWFLTSEGNAVLVVDEGNYRGSLVSGMVAGVVASGFSTGNLALRLLVKPETALPDGTVGLDIYLRRANPERYYRVSLGDTEGTLWKRVGEHEQALLTFPCQLVTGAWQSLAFDSIDWELSGSLNTGEGWQELFVHADIAAPILTGTVGVGLSGGALNEHVVRFDDVLIAALDTTLTVVPSERVERQLPSSPDLALRVFPNPANPLTTLTFQLPTTGSVRVVIHALDGSLVATLSDGIRAAGPHRLVWRGCDDAGRVAASGTYVCRIIAGDATSSRKFVLAR